MNYEGIFNEIREHCLIGEGANMDAVMAILDRADLPETRAVDFYLGLTDNPAGEERLEWYLFGGSRRQRNYCALFFARRNRWDLVNRAYSEGKIDYRQAYSR